MCLKTLFRKLSEYHGKNVLILSSPVFVNVTVFISELAQSLHLVKNTDDDVEYCLDRVALAVTNECLALQIKRNMYHINTDKELVRDSVGDTVALLLSKISSIFDKVAGNDVEREHYNRESVLPTNIPPSNLRGTDTTE